MDKREEKTLNDIQQAFSTLINKKDYLDITINKVEEIKRNKMGKIDRAYYKNL